MKLKDGFDSNYRYILLRDAPASFPAAPRRWWIQARHRHKSA